VAHEAVSSGNEGQSFGYRLGCPAPAPADLAGGGRMNRLGKALVFALFGLLYSWDVWEAVGNLVGLGPFYEALGIGVSMPWALLWAGVLLPIVVFAGAWWWGTKRSHLLEKTVVLVMGWAVIAALSLSFAALEQAWRASALQGVVG